MPIETALENKGNFDIAKLMKIQSELNEYTLRQCAVHTVPDVANMCGPVGAHSKASMELAARDGTFLRHNSPLIQVIDMYQWAGNRELLELAECQQDVNGISDVQNARVECVDIMHFDLSILILIQATPEEINEAIETSLIQHKVVGLSILEDARVAFDNLQLRKWWTTKTITLEEIRNAALKQFAALITVALRYDDEAKPSFLFKSLADIEQTYLKKVQVNYDRITAGYNHVTNKEMGNAKV